MGGGRDGVQVESSRRGEGDAGGVRAPIGGLTRWWFQEGWATVDRRSGGARVAFVSRDGHVVCLSLWTV